MKPEIDRRKLVGILVVVAFGIPILIELFTFSGIISNQILGHGNDGSNSTDGTDPDVLTVGDELLPSTERSETLRDTYILIEGERWVFHLEVEVGEAGGQTNTTPSDRGDAGYVLRIKDVVTGSRVVSEERVLRLDPNETSVLVAEWNLTRGEIPRRLNVSVEADGRRFDRSVRLGRVPVRQRVYE